MSREGFGQKTKRVITGVDFDRATGKAVESMAHSYEEQREIEGMLEDCLQVKSIASDQGGPGYDKRSQDFLDSISEQWEERGTLTEKQLSWLRDLYDRI